MKNFGILQILAYSLIIALSASAQDQGLVVGPNINMVSGTTWPDGDPFLRQQNEPTVAISSRNKLHALAGANDYRTVDIPGDQDAGATGDSWLSYFWSINGGATWKSTLIPGYPQSCSEFYTPLCDYAAAADPVIRAGADGMFYYSGIVFGREEVNPSSAIFVSRFIDLNNDEGGDPIRYIDTQIIDTNTLFSSEELTGNVFLDKSWIAVDLPRSGATQEFEVTQRDGTSVSQLVQCGDIYVAYAGLAGDGADLRSEIHVKRSSDCGSTWDDLGNISEPDSLNQGANIAIDPTNGTANIAWRRFDTVEAFMGTPASGCSKMLADWGRKKKKAKAIEWPVQQIEIGALSLTREEALDLLAQNKKNDESIQLAQQLVAAKLNLIVGGGQASDTFDPAAWTETLSGLVTEANQFLVDYPLHRKGKNDKGGSKKTKFAGTKLDGSAKAQAIELQLNLEENYLGSADCVATSGVEATSTGESNAIMWSSANAGSSFSAPSVVAEAATFDQGGTNFSFRTTAYPSIAVDASGRTYVVFSARGFASNRSDAATGDGRIVLTRYDGNSWSAPYAIDDSIDIPGHQFKPSILFAGGKLVAVYYDLRDDVSRIFEPFILDVPEEGRLRHTMDVRVAVAQIDLLPLDSLPQFSGGDVTTQRASRYAFGIIGNGVPYDPLQLQFMVPNLPTHAGGTQPFIGDYVDVSAKTFIQDNGVWRYASYAGDVDVFQAVWTDNRDIIRPPDGDWTQYTPPNIDPATGEVSTGARTSLYDGSEIDACASPEQAASTGSRNQNVYTAALTTGVVLVAPGNNRPLQTPPADEFGERRVYVLFTQNTTSLNRHFRLELATGAGVVASFNQFDLAFADPGVEPEASATVQIGRFSGAAQTVHAALKPNGVSGPITVTIIETDELGDDLPAGLSSSVVLNADTNTPPPLFDNLAEPEFYTPSVLNPSVLNPSVLNPSVLNPSVLNPSVLNPSVLNPSVFNPSVLNPSVLNPSVFNTSVFNPSVFNPSVLNPSILNPSVFNPSVLNPSVLNPSVLNPSVFNPSVLNPSVLNPSVLNPSVFNPSVLNPSVLNPSVLNSTVEDATAKEVTFQVRNDGTATGAYDIDLGGAQDSDGLSYEIIVYRLNVTPIAEGCNPGVEAQQELIASVVEPGNGLDSMTTASFYIPPGEEVYVTIRALPDATSPTPVDPATIPDIEFDLEVGVTPQAVPPSVAPPPGSTGPGTVPTSVVYTSDLAIVSGSLPTATVGLAYSALLQASGGSGAVTWALVNFGSLAGTGLSLDSQTGEIAGTPLPGATGLLTFEVLATDDLQSVQGTVELQIITAAPPGFVAVPNFSFEETEVLATAPGITQAVGWTSNGADGTGGSDPEIFGFTAAAEGQRFHYLNLPGFGGPDPSVTQSNAGLIGPAEVGTYALTVAAGRRNNDATTDGSYVIEILAGGVVIGSQTVVDPFNSYVSDSWNEITAVAVVNAGDPAVGQDLTIRLSAYEGTGTGIRHQGQFDNVRLTLTPSFVEADIPARYYEVPVANPGYLAREGAILEFAQSPRNGTALSLNESTGEPTNQPFVWSIDDGRLRLFNFSTSTDSNYFNTTATQAQLDQLFAEEAATGMPIEITSNVTEDTHYARIGLGPVETVIKEVSRQVTYDPIPMTVIGPDPILQLAPSTTITTSTETLRDGNNAPAVALSDNCAALDGSVCVPGSWGGSYRYAPGIRYFDESVLPTTSYADVLTFSSGSQAVNGLISGVAATWSVLNDRLLIDYGDGWTQTVTLVGQNNLEYGAFSEFNNTGLGQRYASYDIYVKSDGFTFQDAYLRSQPGRYWNGEINAWFPESVDGNGMLNRDNRFGWDFDDSTDPNSGFNRFNDGVGSLFLVPNEWAIEPTGRVKIDRRLDTQLALYDRYWQPLASTVINGDRQFYVIEFEERDNGLLFAPRLNIEREIDKLPDSSWTSIETVTPFICETSSVQFNSGALTLTLVNGLGSEVPNGESRFVRYDFNNAILGTNLTGASLQLLDAPGSVALVAGGSIGDSFAIFEIIADSDTIPVGSVVQLMTAGDVTLTDGGPLVRISQRIFETATEALNPLPFCD